MEKRLSRRFNTAQVICFVVYCVLFYVSCYFMIPYGWKLLFLIVFCGGGFAIPMLPLLIAEQVRRKGIVLAIRLLLCIPIVLFGMYWGKLYLLSDCQYVMPNTTGIKYKISAEWNLLENKYVGEEFKRFIYSDSRGERIKYNTAYSASYGEMIDLSLRVRENDQYDESEFAICDIAIPVELDFGSEQKVTQTIDLKARTGLTYEGESFIDEGGHFRVEDYGSALWQCTVTVKRLFDFWEVIGY